MTPEQAIETLRRIVRHEGVEAVSVLAEELERARANEIAWSKTAHTASRNSGERRRRAEQAEREKGDLKAAYISVKMKLDAAVVERDRLRGYLDITRGERDEWARRNEAAVAERDAIGAALGEPCAECGAIDWRSDGYLEAHVARATAGFQAWVVAEMDKARAIDAKHGDSWGGESAIAILHWGLGNDHAIGNLVAESARLREALERIAAWDCLNPPDANLCADHPWLKRHVDDALARAALREES